MPTIPNILKSSKPVHEHMGVESLGVDADRSKYAFTPLQVQKTKNKIYEGTPLTHWEVTREDNTGIYHYVASSGVADNKLMETLEDRKASEPAYRARKIREHSKPLPIVNTRVDENNIAWLDNLVLGVSYFNIITRRCHNQKYSSDVPAGYPIEPLFMLRRIDATAPPKVLVENSENLLVAFIARLKQFTKICADVSDAAHVVLQNFVAQMYAIKDAQWVLSADFFFTLLSEKKVLGAFWQSEIEDNAAATPVVGSDEEEFYPGIRYIYSVMPTPAENRLYSARDITQRILSMDIPEADRGTLLLPYQEVMMLTYCADTVRNTRMGGFTIKDMMLSVRFPVLTPNSLWDILDVPVNAGEIVNMSTQPVENIMGIITSDEYQENKTNRSLQKFMKKVNKQNSWGEYGKQYLNK